MEEKDKAMWVQTLWDPLDKMNKSPLHSKEEGIRVAAYCRVSLDSKGVSESLQSQVSHYTHIIKSKPNWRFIGIYFDNLVSGRKASLRRGFTRMLRHCEEDKIDLILVKNVSRFSRNTKELIEIIERLKELNVTVFFETENIESTREETTYLLKTYASIAQGEIEASSQAIEWGHEKRILKGIPYIHRCYGYNRLLIDGEEIIEINEEQAAVVRDIYQMYLEGFSFNRIAAILMERGIKTFAGKDVWKAGIIKSMLSNVTYTGNAIIRKKIRDLWTNKYFSSEGIRNQYFIENSHPAIISEDTFKKVQVLLAKNKKAVDGQKKTHRVGPLSRRLICGNCGNKFNHKKAGNFEYYKCSKAIVNKGICAAPALKIEAIREMMLKAFENRFEFEEPSICKKMLRILMSINRNDHFEFHRLQALTKIDMAKSLRGKKFTDTDIQKMEQEYLDFENQLEKIEDDRIYRDEAIEWISGINSILDFKEQATLAHLRAWILEIVIYSKDDYKVFWIDGVETEIGLCIPANVIETEYTVEESKTSISKDSINSPVKGGELVELDEGETVMQTSNVELVMPDLIMAQVRREIQNSMAIQSNVPQIPSKKIRVAAYVRVSTDEEHQEMSLKTQSAFYSYLILKDPMYEMVDIYVDDGISGISTKDRTGFNRMIEDCKAGRIDLIITKSISRFSRNTVDVLSYIDMLNNLDPPTKVWFERENLRSDDERSSLLIKLMGALGQEESRSSGESIAWGKRNLAQRGIIHPTQISYGYCRGKNKEWEIEKEEAKVVKRIYKEYLNGRTINAIAKLLTQDDIPTPGGQRHWCHTTLQRILTSEIYLGNYIYQRFHRGFRLEPVRTKNNGELPMYYIENRHPAIIESEEWEIVQKMIIKREEERRNKIIKYPKDEGKNGIFTKKLYCGECGNVVGYFRSIIRHRNNTVERRWRCHRAAKGQCHAFSLRQKYIEENFMQLLTDIKHNPKFLEYLQEYKETLKVDLDEKQLIKELEEKRESLNRELYEAVEDELGKKGKDVRKVDLLTESILKIKEKLDKFKEREEQLAAVEIEVDLLMQELEGSIGGKKDNIGYYTNASVFQEKLFAQFIERGIIQTDGRIIFRFNSGFEWSAPISYEHFKIKEKEKRDAKKALEKERYLKGPEVKRLIDYCKEPKSLAEMRVFFGKYAANTAFKKAIINPLVKKGMIKLTIPDNPSSRNQKYYS